MSTEDFILDLFLFFANSCFLLLSALLVSFKIRWRSGIFDVILPLFLWIFFASFFVFFLGLTGCLSPWHATGLSIIGTIVLTLFFRADFSSISVLYKQQLTQVWEKASKKKILAVFLGLLVVILTARMLIHALFWPPFIWDTLSYHLPKVADWIQYEKLVMIDTAVFRSFWPANFELLQTWFVLFFHHDIIVEMAGIPYFYLSVASVYACVRSFNCSLGFSLFLSLVFACTPALVLGTVSAKNDIAVAGLYLMILAVILDYKSHGKAFINQAAVCMMALLIAIGTKPYIVFIFPGIIVVSYWVWAGKIGQMTSNGHVEIFPAKSMSVMLVAAAGMSGYWYIRNWYLFKNPFFPAQFKLFGHTIFHGSGSGQQGAFSLDSLNQSMGSVITERIFDPGLLNPDLPNKAGWGWFAIAVGLPSLISGLLFFRESRWVGAGLILSLILLLGWVTHDPWFMRFALWFPASLVIAYGILMNHVQFPMIRNGLIWLVVICTGLNFIGSLNNGYTHIPNWKNMASIPLFQRNASDLTSPSFISLQKILPENESVAYYTNDNGPIYCLYGSNLSHRIYYLDLKKYDDITEEMKRRNLTYLYAEANPNITERLNRMTDLRKLKKLGKGIYQRTLQ